MALASPKPAARAPGYYRTILRQELARRRQHNFSYSLRAFARDLDVAPSTVSEILRGHHGFSLKTAMQVASVLGLSGRQHTRFVDSVIAEILAKGAI